MSIHMVRFERLPSTSRSDFGQATLQFCRTRRINPKVTSSRYFWADGGNTVVVLTEGEPGAFDWNPSPDPAMTKALYAMHDVARNLGSEMLQDAGRGSTQWRDIGAPEGVSRG